MGRALSVAPSLPAEQAGKAEQRGARSRRFLVASALDRFAVAWVLQWGRVSSLPSSRSALLIFGAYPADRTAALRGASSTYRPLDREIGCGDKA
jgi:hypothetical protein